MRASNDVVVIGAGVVGIVTALEIARAGARVTLIDEGRPTNASSVAAGMLAPASETLLEHGDAAAFARLLAARDLWSTLERSVMGLAIDRSGAEVALEGGESIDDLAMRAAAMGAEVVRERDAVLLPQDWRLDPSSALPSLKAAAAAAGVRARAGRVTAQSEGLAVDGVPIVATSAVIAAGFGARALAAAAPELAALTPIKGQIAAFSDAGASGRTRRAAGVYLAPQPSGLRVGATMEAGKHDDAVEELAIATLARQAAALQPELATAAVSGAAGVRAATPDGWPLVGPSRTPGVWLAVGARRNGWLLAPLMAGLMVDHLEGRAEGDLARAFHPGRFSR